MLGQKARRLLLGHVPSGGHERHRGHRLANGARRELAFGDEAQIAVGDDPQELVVPVDDGQAGDAVFRAQRVKLGDRRLGADRRRIVDHAGFGALDLADLLGLSLDGKVAVDDSDSALASHGDGHSGLGHGVHRGRNQRRFERKLAGQAARSVHLGGDDVGFTREQKDVVIRQTDEFKGVASAHGAILRCERMRRRVYSCERVDCFA